MSKERLEEIKEHFRWTLNNSLVPRLHDSEIEWLIEQAERLEAIIKHRNDILKANEYLNEQNQRYKQALEFYADEESYEPLEVQIGAVTKEGYKISKYKYDPKINTDKGEKARQALEGEAGD